MDRKYLIGAGLMAGAVLLVPGLAPALSRAGRPASRRLVKAGVAAYAEAQKLGAEAFEHAEDLVAEFRAELAARHAAAAEEELREAAAPADAGTTARDG